MEVRGTVAAAMAAGVAGTMKVAAAMVAAAERAAEGKATAGRPSR